tara:strand:+ start:26780 stop:27736 length:957 start_codon:yes stop_codon:yes gene_type:complete
MKEKILQYLKVHLEASPKEIADAVGCSRQLVHRYLTQLLANSQVEKIGKPPLVFYQFTDKQISKVAEEVSEYETLDFIEITVDGRYLKGIKAFQYWCEIRNQPFQKTLDEYRLTLTKYERFNQHGYIDGTTKLTGTKGFTEFGLTKLLYLDFYAIERFGKTKLGKLIHYGKQSQSRKLIAEIIELATPRIASIVKEYKIDAVGYIPPTLPREVQIMTELERGFGLKLPHLKITKVKGDIVVPQKALSKIKDRILNTQKSIVVRDTNKYDTVLLIDDAVGSGATLNETALKMVKKGVAKKVIGVAITGSYKGFEVLNEA